MKVTLVILALLVVAFVVATTCGFMGSASTTGMVDTWTARLKAGFGGPPAVPLADLKPRPGSAPLAGPTPWVVKLLATPWVADIAPVDDSGLLPKTPVRVVQLRLRTGQVQVEFEPRNRKDERGVAVQSKLTKPLDITVRSGGGRLTLTNPAGASVPAEVELRDSR